MADLDFNSDKSLSNILDSAYQKASPPSEYRERLLQELKHAATVQEAPRPLWRMSDWAIIAAVIILTIIAYGIWVPQSIVAKLLP